MSVSAPLQTKSPSQAVIEAVADREGVDSMDLSIPLYDVIDPESLDTIIQTKPRYNESALRIEFTYYGYTISVSADGSVQVSDAT